jgi:hypothetical protein
MSLYLYVVTVEEEKEVFEKPGGREFLNFTNIIKYKIYLFPLLLEEEK